MILPRAMILAAGLGSRLRPLTNEVPKALMWLGDRPQIDHIIAALAAAGLDEVVVNTHHLADQFDDAWVAAQPIEVLRSFEPEILGQGGGIAAADALLGRGDVLAWNADIVTTLDVRALTRAHEKSGAVATLVVGERLLPRIGTLGLSAAGEVVRLRALDLGGEVGSADYAGIVLLSERLRTRLMVPSCLVENSFVPALRRGDRVATFTLSAPFVDIGSPRALLDANLGWLASRGFTSFVHPSAEVSPTVALDRTVVGPKAKVLGSGEFACSLVFPHATAHSPESSAIVARSTTLRFAR